MNYKIFRKCIGDQPTEIHAHISHETHISYENVFAEEGLNLAETYVINLLKYIIWTITNLVT